MRLRAFVWCAVIVGAVGNASAQQAAPVVASISPSRGPVAGGTTVILSGSGFTAGTTVAFNRRSASNVQVIDATRIQATTPPLEEDHLAVALAAVRVSNAVGTAYAEFLYVPPTFDEIGIGDITTIAGVGNFVGEGRQARQAMFEVNSLAFDHSGNLYTSDETTGRVRRVGPDGRVVTVAGSVGGFSGDGGPATEARFNFPAALALDRQGNLYIADAVGNNRIRRVDAATGIVRTIAGTGVRGFSGDGGPATQAMIDTPTSSLAIDAQGNLFFADAGNQRIRRIDTSGVIATIAGTGATGFSGDGGPATGAAFNLGSAALAVDSRGTLFVADAANTRIRRVGGDGRVTTVCGGGGQPLSDGANALDVACFVEYLALDRQERVVFTAERRVWRIEENGRLTRLAGTGSAALSADGIPAVEAALLSHTIAVAPNGDIVVGERSARRIRRIDAVTGIISTVAGIGPGWVGESGEAIAAAFGDAGNVGLDRDGNVLVVDSRGSLRIRRLDASGAITTVAGTGVEAIQGLFEEGMAAAGAAMAPHSVQADAAGNIYYTDFCSLRRIGTDGRVRTVVGPTTSVQDCGYFGDGVPGTSAKLGAEHNTIRVDRAGNVFISDLFSNRVRRWDAATGIVATFAGNGAHGITGDGGPARQAAVAEPADVAFHPRGDICIAGVSSIRCVDAQGIIRTLLGPGAGGLAINPWRIAFDPAGNLYLSDIDNSVIRKLDASGSVTTVAGIVGRPGFSGDGGPATQARINFGSGLALDAQGNILIFDGVNLRVRVIKKAPRLGGPAAAANMPGPLSGLWWNPGESGWGINLTQRGNILFAAWYTYDAAGNPKWYVASRCVLSAAAAGGGCSDSLYEVNGPRFFAPSFDAAAVRVAAAGTLQLSFTGTDAGSMTYTVAGQTRTVPITRQIFASGGAPAVDYTDLWWNATESGWGMAITHQANVMFLAWYVYDDAGRPVWYVASDCRANAAQTGCSGSLYRTTGPPFGPTFASAAVRVSDAGTVNVTFTDPNNATLTYVVNGVSGSKTITRQLF